MANLSTPDMRLPILYALAGGAHLDAGAQPISLFDMPQLTFEPCDTQKFPFVQLAYDSLRMGGNACVVTNAANEVAVGAFLQDRIHIGSIIDTVFSALDALFDPAELSYGEILDADRRAREYAAEKLGRL